MLTSGIALAALAAAALSAAPVAEPVTEPVVEPVAELALGQTGYFGSGHDAGAQQGHAIASAAAAPAPAE